MLNTFDWIRRSRSGAELMATLNYFRKCKPDLFPEEKSLANAVTLFDVPCSRCWIYPCEDPDGEAYCRICKKIVTASRKMGHRSRHSVVVWGYVNQIPKNLESGKGFYSSDIVGAYVHDDSHFMLVLDRYKIKPWLQELLLYHGADLKGLLQIFPTTGKSAKAEMSDIINRAIHQDSRYPMDTLRVRFFSRPYQVFSPRERDNAGILTFSVMEFLELLQMAFIFRSLLRPEDQDLLRELINLDNITDGRFQWSRFAATLKPEARDMLNSWNIRTWSENQIILLYELLDYVEYVF
ncbi:hypothetical protein MTBBW1_1040068 [Desulfamplus magnetovallimortis]|uniref:Uncharacterized protein n=1 Tax=Desulfamplus magnetovallimortis TaxID=1246637 RepID=A0A1W1H563_9BACT|nr:hypothetical protein [Desulfamplus magnetovallimortis]SLM27611.1 hypothetical protein MTBBW1_1040068 [Desulfamplus magnetovallimortis]